MVKMELRAMGEKALKESWVLETAEIHPRCWTTLKRWELQRYGEQRITDLSRSEAWQVVGLPDAGAVVPYTSGSTHSTP